MPPRPDFLANSQNDLCERIRTRVQIALNSIDVQQMRPRTEREATAIMESINRTLAGKSNRSGGTLAGLAVLVPLPAYENTNPNMPGLYGKIVFSVIVLENILINAGSEGTGVSCEQAAIEVMLAGHHFQIADNRTVVCDGMVPMKLDGEDFNADIAYEITFRAAAGFSQEAECGQPSIVSDEGSITVSTATAGATIYLTTNGTLPTPQNPDAITVPNGTPIDGIDPAGATLRAVAYKADLNPSLPAFLRV